MGFAPLAHALDVCGAPEMVAVSRFAQPAAVTFGLAGGAALRFGAKPLMPSVPKIGIEQLFAMQTLKLIGAGHPGG
jgi:hypothetical protein